MAPGLRTRSSDNKASAHPLGPAVPHVPHQEPEQLGVVLVAVAHAVLVALPLVLLHHLDAGGRTRVVSE